ncbi:hypothetical protein [Rhizobium chutanense]|uniref:hypothetical protein n=1 Tax=Rhizobium chutanense TaxID=2035448 RepID=UPI00117B302F|nr:hypothetical protein [Rhizobium chutanense]
MPIAAILTKRFFTLLSPCWHGIQQRLAAFPWHQRLKQKTEVMARNCPIRASFIFSFNGLYAVRDERSLNGETFVGALQPQIAERRPAVNRPLTFRGQSHGNTAFSLTTDELALR